MPDYIPYISYAAAIISMTAAVYATAAMYRSWREMNETRSTLVESLHSLSLVTRGVAHAQRDGGANDEEVYSTMADLLDVVQKAVESISGGDVDCSIKMMASDPGGSKPYLLTIARDSGSMDREVLRLKYPIDENSLLAKVLSTNTVQHATNISTLSEGGFVTTEHANLKKQVRSVIAVPIHYSEAGVSNAVAGVITIESTRPYAFSDSVTQFAMLAANMIGLMIGFVGSRRLPGDMNERVSEPHQG